MGFNMDMEGGMDMEYGYGGRYGYGVWIWRNDKTKETS
jgi:hypothetical protein